MIVTPYLMERILMNPWFRSCFMVATLLCTVVGCSSEPQPPKLPDPVKVTGTVTLDGKPLEGAAIRFAPTSDKEYHGATGQSDASGKYELNTDIGNGKTKPGVVPGNYSVYISRLVKPDGSFVPVDSKEPPMMSGARDTIPLKYSTEKGRMTYTVTQEGGTFDIKLDSKAK